MTGEDHDTDALIATLTSPALQSEQVGEEAAVTAMLGAMSAVPAAPAGHRSRRGIAIAAVTVASLGVGGLVAAGPGNFFTPATDRPPTSTGPAATTGATDDDSPPSTDGDPSGTTLPGSDGATATIVGSIVTPGIDLTDVQTESTDPSGGKDGNPSNTAPGQTGESPSDTAPGQTGESPSDTAPGQTGESPSDTAPGQTGESPSDTAPGQTGESPSDTAPGRTGGNGRP